MPNPSVEVARIQVGYRFLSKLCHALNVDERQLITGINIDCDAADGVVHVTVRRVMAEKEGDDVIECLRGMAESPAD